MPSKKLYKMILDEEQLSLVDAALELHTRIGMGQLREIIHVLRGNDKARFNDGRCREEAERRLDEVKHFVMNLQGGSYLGIHSPELSNVQRVAYDMHQVIRHRLSWDRNPEPGWDTSKDPPSKISYTEEKLIQVAPATDADRLAAAIQSRAHFLDLKKTLYSTGKHDCGVDREIARLEREITAKKE